MGSHNDEYVLMPEVIIRKATIFDHGEILNLSIQWFEELAINGFPLACPDTGVWLADLIANHIVLVGEYEDAIIGCIGVRIGFMPWNYSDKVLLNDVFMTDKRLRNTGVAGKLLDAIKQFAEDNNLMLVMGHVT